MCIYVIFLYVCIWTGIYIHIHIYIYMHNIMLRESEEHIAYCLLPICIWLCPCHQARPMALAQANANRQSIYIYIYRHIYIYIAEAGGFSPTGIFLSFRSSPRALWMSGGNGLKTSSLQTFPFPLWLVSLCLFPLDMMTFPLSVVRSCASLSPCEIK